VSVVNLLYITRPAVGGMREHVCSLITQLNRNRYHPALAAPDDTWWRERCRSLGIDFFPLAISDGLRPLADYYACQALGSLLDQGHFSLLHLHGAKSGLVALAASRSRPVKVVYTAHGFPARPTVHPLKQKLYAWGEVKVAARCHRTIAVSQAVAKEMVRRCRGLAGKIIVIPNGIDLDKFNPAVPGDPFRRELGLPRGVYLVGTVGRLVPEKGLEFLLEAIPLVRHHLANTHFVITGDGPLRQYLEEQARSLGIADAVTFTGYRQDITRVLAALDLFLLPSVSEGQSVSLLEAMAMAKPSVVTRVGGMVELVGETGERGLVVGTRDPVSLARAALSLLADPEKRNRLGRSARQHVERHYPLSKMAEKTEEVYDSLCGRDAG